MDQKYNNLDSQSRKIPSTRIESWKIFRDDGQKHTIKNFILVILEDSDTPLSCRQISEISEIEIQSLTRPLQELSQENVIDSTERVKGVRERSVIAYSIVKSDKNV